MESGESWADRKFVLVAKNQKSTFVTTRFGFSISKRIGNAVARNQMKRRLRSIVGSFNHNVGWDVVLIARKGAIDAKYQEIERSVSGLLIKAGISIDERESK